MSNYIIIPGCCDLNRGDQALGWETARVAKDAGFKGTYSLLAERGEPIEQSIAEGYQVLTPVLEHPSRKFTNKENIIYDKKTKLFWGGVALKDLLFSLLILFFPAYREHIVKTTKDKCLRDTLSAFQRSDAVFMKGGGLIQSHGGLISTYATYYRIYHILLAHALHKPVYILPNSFGPFDGPGVKWMVKRALRKCFFVCAREKKSKEECANKLGLSIPVFPDLAFYLPNGNMSRQELCKMMNIDPQKKIVAITMRPYRFPNSPDPEKAYEIFKKEMQEFISMVYSAGYMPLIIEHTFAITSHENDGDCIRDVIKDLDRSKYRLLSDRSLNCRDLKSVYGCCDYIVGTRFHSLIFSLSNMVPGVAISYDGYKSIGIMKDMGLEDYVLDIGDVTANALFDMLLSIISDEEQIRQKIKNYCQSALLQREVLIQSLRKGAL